MPTLLDGFAGFLEHRCTEGCRSAAQLHRELTSRGFTARFQTVARWASRRGVREPVSAVLAEASVTARWKPPSVRRCAWLLSQPDDQLKPEERAFMRLPPSASPEYP